MCRFCLLSGRVCWVFKIRGNNISVVGLLIFEGLFYMRCIHVP